MKTYKLILFFVAFMLNGFLSYSQTDGNENDSIVKASKISAKMLLNFDSHRSYVLGQRIKMNGLRIGVEFRDKYRLGLGFYHMKNPVMVTRKFVNGANYIVNLKLNYSTLFTEYVFYEDFRFEASACAAVGIGKGVLSWKNQRTGKDTAQSSPSVPIFTISSAIFYHPISWIGIGGGIGGRVAFVGDKNIKKAFNSPFYVIKIKVILGNFYKSIFKRKEVRAQRAAYRIERAERIKKRNQRQEEKRKN